MINYILFDQEDCQDFYPIALTRPISELLFGIMTIKDKWKFFFGNNISYKTKGYLSKKYPLNKTKNNIFINSSVCPNELLVDAIKDLKMGEFIEKEGKLIAYFPDKDNKYVIKHKFIGDILDINNIWDLFKKNNEAIESDFKLLTKNRKTQEISNTNIVLGSKNNIFLEEGVKIECSILNVENGFMYFKKNSSIMEGSMIRGSISVGEGAIIKMGSKIYGATTIGDYCKIGGEINNSVIFSFSNKSHDGFLGNSILGEWCNLGANTNNSNLKNNYSKVSIWSYKNKDFIKTTEMFLGLIMGDHSKSGISTMFNTGTIVGCFCNIFGSGFPKKYIPNFSWGNDKLVTYKLDKALETANTMMLRRNSNMTNDDKYIYEYIFDNFRE